MDCCWVLSQVRGDFHLFKTLLTVVCRVADYSRGHFAWRGQKQTVVLLGNFSNRFSPTSFTRKTLNTGRAIEDEIRILAGVRELQEAAQRHESDGNRFVVLVGEREMGCLARWSAFDAAQMANPGSPVDREARRAYVEGHLRPFCAQQRLLYRWGRDGGWAYFSSGGLRADWLEAVVPVSSTNTDRFATLQRHFRHWVEHSGLLSSSSADTFPNFYDRASPVRDEHMSLRPRAWVDEERDRVTRWLNGSQVTEPNPRFVLGHTLVSRLAEDPATAWAYTRLGQKGEFLTFQPDGRFSAVVQTHNGHADAFACQAMSSVSDVAWAPVHAPQALCLELTQNRHSGRALYVTLKARALTLTEYGMYTGHRPLHLCLDPPGVVAPEIEAEPEDNDHQVGCAFGVVLTSDEKKIFLVRSRSSHTWHLPGGARRLPESSWATWMRHARQHTRNTVLFRGFQPDRSREVHYSSQVVLFVLHVPPEEKGDRFAPNVHYDQGGFVDLSEAFRLDLALPTKQHLCALAAHQVLPVSVRHSAKAACAAWNQDLE